MHNKKMKVFYLIFFLLLSCSSQDIKSKRSESIKVYTELETNIEKQDSLFEIASIDYHNKSIQRIFVVIPTEKVNNQDYIKSVVCSLNTDYKLTSKSHISFFVEKRFAGYKENVFEGMSTIGGMTSEEQVEYKKWLNTYYLSEYDCSTREYLTYPASGNSEKMKKYLIKECA